MAQSGQPQQPSTKESSKQSPSKSSPKSAVLGKTPGKFLSLCFTAMVMVLGNSLLIPVLPSMVESLDISELQAGLTITAFSIAAGVTIPFAGLLSDRVGRKKVIVPSLILYGLAGVAAGFTGMILKEKSLILLLVLRAIQGIGAGGTFQIAMALTGDLFTSGTRTRALGYLEASNGLGKVIAPLIGATLAALVWYAPFFVYAVTIPVAIFVWVEIKEPPMKQKAQGLKGYLKAIGQVFAKKGVPLLTVFLAGMLVLFFYFGVLSYLSDFLEERLHVRGVKLGLIIAIPVSVMAITSYLSGQGLAKKNPNILKWVIVFGLAFGGTMLALAGTTKKEWLLVGFISVLSIGNGLILPSLNTLTTGCTDKLKRGMVTSLYGTVRHVGAATGPPAVALLVENGHRTAFWVLAGLAAGAAVLTALLLNTKVLLRKEGQGGSAGGGEGQPPQEAKPQSGARPQKRGAKSYPDSKKYKDHKAQKSAVNDGEDDEDDAPGWQADIP